MIEPKNKAGVPILMYHKVAPVNPRSTLKGHYVPPRLFLRQMEALAARGYRPIPLSDICNPNNSDRSIVLTFDDGYENFFLNALPVLVRLGFPATVFLVAGQLGGTNVWDKSAGDVEERLMNLTQIREAQHAGLEFGSHTPYGRKTPAVRDMVERAGYRLACSTEKGINTAETDTFALRRVNVRRDTAVPILFYKLRRDLARAP
jgi:hypothetical protein